MMLDLGVRTLSARVVAWDLVLERYNQIRPYLAQPFRILTSACEWASADVLFANCSSTDFQYNELLALHNGSSKPWVLSGVFASSQDVKEVAGLPWFRAIWYTYALRLAILYDAPRTAVEELIALGTPSASALDGTIFVISWAFCVAVAALRHGDPSNVLPAIMSELRRQSICESPGD